MGLLPNLLTSLGPLHRALTSLQAEYMPRGLTVLDMQNMRLTGEQQTSPASGSLHMR